MTKHNNAQTRKKLSYAVILVIYINMCAVQYRTVQCSTLLYYTVQYSTQIARTVLYSIVISIPNSLLVRELACLRNLSDLLENLFSLELAFCRREGVTLFWKHGQSLSSNLSPFTEGWQRCIIVTVLLITRAIFQSTTLNISARQNRKLELSDLSLKKAKCYL